MSEHVVNAPQRLFRQPAESQFRPDRADAMQVAQHMAKAPRPGRRVQRQGGEQEVTESERVFHLSWQGVRLPPLSGGEDAQLPRKAAIMKTAHPRESRGRAIRDLKDKEISASAPQTSRPRPLIGAQSWRLTVV